MKKVTRLLQFALPLMVLFAYAQGANGQILKKLGKAAERAAERTVERRVEKETAEKTDQVLDSILEPGSTGGNERQSPIPGNEPTEGSEPGVTGSDNDSNPSSTSNTPGNTPKSITVYSKFDFVPGDKLLFSDDFSNDFIGDFPSKWNTNGGGELVQIDGEEGKWLKILPGFGTFYIPNISDLPNEFTLEYDVITQGLDKKTSSSSFLRTVVSENSTFDEAKNFAWVEYPFCQFIDDVVTIENRVNGKREIRNDIKVDVRQVVLNKHHISVAVNDQRFRFWINEQKVVDVPRLLPANKDMKAIKLHMNYIDINKENVYVSNFKIAEGGVDLRKKLLADGKISTNGILFDSGSANIQPRSMGIIRQIYQVLQQDGNLKLKIVGHTDSDGDDAKNMQLSEKRAEAVKNALVSVYNVTAERLTTEGKGETEPVGDNGTADGKAQNRRVEFIKL